MVSLTFRGILHVDSVEKERILATHTDSAHTLINALAGSILPFLMLVSSDENELYPIVGLLLEKLLAMKHTSKVSKAR